jgi:fatty acid desaturase
MGSAWIDSYWGGRLLALLIVGPVALLTYLMSGRLRKEQEQNYSNDPSEDQLKLFRRTTRAVRLQVMLGLLAILPAMAFCQFLIEKFDISDNWASILPLVLLAIWAATLIMFDFRATEIICPECHHPFFYNEQGGRRGLPLRRSCFHCGYKP